MKKTISTAWEEVQVGSFLATEIYGDTAIPFDYRGVDGDDAGHDDDYRSYIEGLSRPWVLLDASSLGTHFVGGGIGRFTQGGLYRGTVEEFLGDDEQAEGLLATTTVGGVDALVMAFRGTDSSDKAIADGQAWTAAGNKGHYEAHRPLIEALYSYAVAHGITKVVVSGHSLGGAMVDVFTLVDAKRFEDAGIDLTVVALASPGVNSNLSDKYVGLIDERYASIVSGPLINDKIESLTRPDYYIGINHSEDVVGRPVENPSGFWGDGIYPNWSIQGNIRFASNDIIDLQSVDNADVDYEGGFIGYSKGYGAEHNGQIYLHNLNAITNSPLLQLKTASHSLILGVGAYSAEHGYIGPGPDDVGAQTLYGSSTFDFLLGLEGNDSIVGLSGDDLLDGGSGRDTLIGSGGRDVLFGGTGDDYLSGGTEQDTLQGGLGEDRLEGGTGDDVFFLGAMDASDIYVTHIIDYNFSSGSYDPGEGDVIDLSELVGGAFAGGASFSDLVRVVVSDGDDRFSLQIDTDGAGHESDWFTVAYLNYLPDGSEIAFELDSAIAGTDVILDLAPIVQVGPTSLGPARQIELERSGLEGTVESYRISVETIELDGEISHRFRDADGTIIRPENEDGINLLATMSFLGALDDSVLDSLSSDFAALYSEIDSASVDAYWDAAFGFAIDAAFAIGVTALTGGLAAPFAIAALTFSIGNSLAREIDGANTDKEVLAIASTLLEPAFQGSNSYISNLENYRGAFSDAATSGDAISFNDVMLADFAFSQSRIAYDLALGILEETEDETISYLRSVSGELSTVMGDAFLGQAIEDSLGRGVAQKITVAAGALDALNTVLSFLENDSRIEDAKNKISAALNDPTYSFFNPALEADYLAALGNEMHGTDGDDVFRDDGRRNSKIFGYWGDDTIDGGLGQDTLDGGAGTDLLKLDFTSVMKGSASNYEYLRFQKSSSTND
ncbi:type I secretion C-terminal target domain-containing protein, partial [Shimia sp. CNT1-13L.2]|uniref:lipase family protein n=1 Tax=Shimia sp. CNT1-13L.2 TaxID=2959663 RepID=UPI0020CE31AA|nr:type I secretion C-terminal target domain-containing protein [Shimia sp. CNT1-13L.2]